ncbi:serine/threonine-protein kinase HipA [Polaromonas sp. YR568]|uniref:type II toxin-antitoxin system HipA family toxin n=1 Tax=Polaromonas sp. YR568 TaxID=1855301 RepID=UPI0008E8A280|nr:type II toxin-antitoxin system HipA family toxin [Polaromonas sp. YR568]SFU69944.1 serine/threonine-protein kinase HipA [Polaromonas sp. YR568]
MTAAAGTPAFPDQPYRLDVFFNEERVGSVHDTSPLSFEYSAEWLTRREPAQLAAITLATGRSDAPTVQAFFENLLPEGDLRSYLTISRKASTLFGLLFETAGDTAGGFVILPAGFKPQAPRYEPTSWEALAKRLAGTSAAAIDIRSRETRISLAGAQDKTSIAIFADGVPQLARGTSPSSHILKPDIKRLPDVWHSAANETLLMLTAARCGLPTAEVFFEPHTGACVVKRFDRVPQEGGGLGRLVQYDLCQLSGVVSEKKYEKEGGPALAQCAQLVRQFSSAPAPDLMNLLRWVFFNLYTGNNDSHAKNLSVYQPPGQGVRLTPFYDLMCTRVYPGLSGEFAFAIGGETRPGNVAQAHVRQMAADLGIGPAFALATAKDIAEKIPGALEGAAAALLPALPHGAQTLVGRVQKLILKSTRQTLKRILEK